MKKIVLLAFLLVCHTAVGQVIKVTLYNADNNQPLEFVNSGIVGKNVGTVADFQGRFSLLVDAEYDDETILFTSIGYKPLSISVADLRKNSDNKLFLRYPVLSIEYI